MSAILDIEPTSSADASWLAVLDTEQLLVADPVLFPLNLREITPDILLEIAFPEFGGVFSGPVTVDTAEIDSGHIIATARITHNLDLVMKLVGEPEDRADPFTEAIVEIRHRDSEGRRALDVFVAYTLFALLGLSRSVNLRLRVPRIEPLVPLRFPIPLSTISQYLQSRQIAYKVMIIEQATHEQFFLPAIRSAVEVATIPSFTRQLLNAHFFGPTIMMAG